MLSAAESDPDMFPVHWTPPKTQETFPSCISAGRGRKKSRCNITTSLFKRLQQSHPSIPPSTLLPCFYSPLLPPQPQRRDRERVGKGGGRNEINTQGEDERRGGGVKRGGGGGEKRRGERMIPHGREERMGGGEEGEKNKMRRGGREGAASLGPVQHSLSYYWPILVIHVHRAAVSAFIICNHLYLQHAPD